MSGERFPLSAEVSYTNLSLAFGHPPGPVCSPGGVPVVSKSCRVIRALNDLPNSRGLRCIDAIRVDRRALQVVHLPAAKCGPLTPTSRAAVRGKTKAPLRVQPVPLPCSSLHPPYELRMYSDGPTQRILSSHLLTPTRKCAPERLCQILLARCK